LKETRKVSVVWLCRHPDLLEHYMDKVEFDNDAWTWIFYTGKRKLRISQATLRRNPRVRLCSGRPNLDVIISSIVKNIERNSPMPAELMDQSWKFHRDISACSENDAMCHAFERALSSYSISELFDLACLAIEKAATDDTEGQAVVATGTGQMSRAAFSMFFRQSCHVSEALVSDGTINQFFDNMDTSGNSWVDFQEFVVALSSLGLDVEKAGELTLLRGMTDVDTEQEELAGILTELELSSWQLLYCGGSGPVVKALRKISKQHNMALRTEAFDW